jgi:hypothetical protein
MGKVIWLFSDNYSTDVAAADILARHGMVPVYAWCIEHFAKHGRLSWEQAQRLLGRGFEVHNHALVHENWVAMHLTGTEIAQRLRDSWKWWNEAYPGGAASQIMGVPYTSSEEIKALALAGGEDWGPFRYVLTNWLDPWESVALPAGYAYRWQTAYCSQGLSEMYADLSWAGAGEGRVLFAAFHALVSEPTPGGGMTLTSDFAKAIKRAKALGIESATVLGLGGG